MEQEEIGVDFGFSTRANFVNLIISYRDYENAGGIFVVGYPGLPNAVQLMDVGDAILFETPDKGIIEIRLLSRTSGNGEFLLTQISPRPGLMAGMVSDDPSNTPFTPKEIERIAESLDVLKGRLSKHEALSTEQFNFIVTKLDEIKDASQRLGRKDWIHYVGGTLTSASIGAALSPEARELLFEATNAAFDWLWAGAFNLLS